MVDYQAQIVGMDNVPLSRIRGKWDFIDVYVEKLKNGQALRIILPKGSSSHGVVTHWKRISGGRGKSVQKAQSDGSIKLWLFLKDKPYANL